MHELKTVQNLIDVLKNFDPEASVLGSCEEGTRPLEVYQALNNQVIVDVDFGEHRANWQGLKCTVCGNDATGAPFKAGMPVCDTHWSAFESRYEDKFVSKRERWLGLMGVRLSMTNQQEMTPILEG
jgi:hypothetical protein